MRDIDYRIKTDVLVIGSGLSGSLAALSAEKMGYEVAVVNKGKMCWSGSTVICGGNTMTACFPEDDKEEWMRVYVEHSDYTVDQEWVKIFIEESYGYLEALRALGRKHGLEVFPQDPEKDKDSYWRIYRSVNPNLTTFIDVYAALSTFEKEFKARGIKTYERVSMTDLLMDNDQMAGAVGINNRTGETYLFKTPIVILAAGTCSYTADVFEAGGEGYKMAYDIGAKLMSFDRGGAVVRPRFSMSVGTLFSSTANSSGHAVGGKLINRLGENFFENMSYEMRSSGRVGQNMAIEKEIEEGRGPIFEDYTELSPEVEEALKKLRKPFWMRTKSEHGIDLFEEPVPLAHGVEQTATPDICNRMGGVWIDHHGQTSIKGLYSVGDNTWPALAMQHPFNGAELGWAVLSGSRIGKTIKSSFQGELDKEQDPQKITQDAQHKLEDLRSHMVPRRDQGQIDPTTFKKKIIEIMVPYDKVHESAESLNHTLLQIRELANSEMKNVKTENIHELRLVKEAEGMLAVAEFILLSELSREESRCGMRRKDFPTMDNMHWLKRVGIVKGADHRPQIFFEDIETPYFDVPQTNEPPKIKRI